MRKPVLTIFDKFNPGNTNIGEIRTLVQILIRYAQVGFNLKSAGKFDGFSQGTSKWEEAKYVGKQILFLRLLKLKNDNIRDLITTIVKYMSALFGCNLTSDFMHFHAVRGDTRQELLRSFIVKRRGLSKRLEPTLIIRKWQGEKTLFIHKDIKLQITAKCPKNASIWLYFSVVYLALEKKLVSRLHHILSFNTDGVTSYQQRYLQWYSQSRDAYGGRSHRVIDLNNYGKNSILPQNTNIAWQPYILREA
jgi:hypothetical protein